MSRKKITTQRLPLCVLLLVACLSLSGCTTKPATEVEPETGSPEVKAADTTPEEPSISPEQKEAAMAIVEEINGRLKKDSEGKVVELNLAGRRWADESQVTQILDAFPAIKSLTLEGRKLTDALGPKLATLVNLEVLALRETMVGDGTFALLATKPKLKILDMRVGANLTDAGMDALTKIHTLRAVRFIGCDLSDQQLAKLFDSLPELVEIDLRSSRGFTVATIDKIASKESLRTLKLGGPEINNDMIAPIAKIKNLTSLALEESDVDDAGLLTLADLPLKSLGLVGSLFVTDEGLVVLKNYTNLASLNLQDTGATLKAIPLLSHPEKLVTLDLYQSAIEDDNIGNLARLSNLKNLSLGQTQLSNASLEILSGMTSLEKLNLVQTAITESGIEKLQKDLPKCQVTSQ